MNFSLMASCIFCSLIFLFFHSDAMQPQYSFPEEDRYQLGRLALTYNNTSQAEKLFEQNRNMPLQLFGHTPVNYNNCNESHRYHHIPSVAALAEIKLQDNKYTEAYELANLVINGTCLKKNLNMYTQKAAKVIEHLAHKGNKPAQLVHAHNLFEISHVDEGLRQFAEVQRYITTRDLPNINYHIFDNLLEKIIDKYPAHPVTNYITANAYKRIPLISPNTIFTMYSVAFLNCQLKNDTLYAYKSLQELRDLAKGNPTLTFELIELLANQQQKDLQTEACDLTLSLLPPDKDFTMPETTVETLAKLKLNHPAQLIALGTLQRKKGEYLQDSGQYCKSLDYYKKALQNFMDAKIDTPMIKQWLANIKGSIANIYFQIEDIQSAVPYFEQSAQYLDSSKIMLAYIYFNNYWSKEGIILQSPTENDTPAAMPLEKFNKIIEMIKNLADEKYDHIAAATLAELYLGGEYRKLCCNRSLQKNLRKSFHYAKLAEEKGSKSVHKTLYYLYRNGIPLDKNPAKYYLPIDKNKALEHLEKAIEISEDHELTTKLIIEYINAKDFKKAYPWIKKICEKNILAATLMAWYAAIGISEETDFKPSAKSNIKEALNYLHQSLHIVTETRIINYFEFFMELQQQIRSRIFQYLKKNPTDTESKNKYADILRLDESIGIPHHWAKKSSI